MPLEDQISPEHGCYQPLEVTSPNWPYLESTRVPHCCDRNNDSNRGGRENTKYRRLALKNHQMETSFSIFALTSWKSGHLTLMPWLAFEVRFKKKALFSAHCVQNLIYRSWPWLLFCATTTLENNGRKAWNLRGTESALFNFFSALIEWRIFPPRVK